MKNIKIYYRKITFSSGTTTYQVLKEYEKNGRKITQDCGRYSNLFFGKLLAKRKVSKLKKFYDKYDFSEDDYVIDEIVD